MVSSVKKRHVFYLSGFDPRGPAFYRRLYAHEGAKQSAINGIPLVVGERARSSTVSNHWEIHAEVEGQNVETRYEFLRWDDIIRKHWQRNELLIVLHYLQVAWICISSGIFGRVLKTAWPPFVTALFPLVLILLLAMLASGVGYSAASVIAAAGLPTWIAAGTGIAAIAGVIQLGRMLEQRVNSYWLLRIYAFTKKQGIDTLPELEQRLDDFARRIIEESTCTDADEILIVGHSTGTMIAISALGRALQLDPKLAKRGPRIALMTLGHCIPILSFVPAAQRFRDEMAAIANAEDIDWIDFTAPTDGACFAFIDPVGASGIVRRNDIEAKPKLLSARYATLFTPQTYAAMKRNWYRHHFQYLMAGELAGDYDYFAITAGALPLAERYRNHAPVTNFTGLKVFK